METLENLRREREVYMQLLRKGRLLLVDGNRSASEVAQDILAVVLKRLESA